MKTLVKDIHESEWSVPLMKTLLKQFSTAQIATMLGVEIKQINEYRRKHRLAPGLTNRDVRLKRLNKQIKELQFNGYINIKGRYLIGYQNQKTHYRVSDREYKLIEIVHQTRGEKGNDQVVFCLDGKVKYLHRVIYKHLIGDIKRGQRLIHIDGDRFNNHINNLALQAEPKNKKKEKE